MYDPFLRKYATFNENGTALLTVGTYTDNKIGYACYHSKLDSAVFIYNRLLAFIDPIVLNNEEKSDIDRLIRVIKHIINN